MLLKRHSCYWYTVYHCQMLCIALDSCYEHDLYLLSIIELHCIFFAALRFQVSTQSAKLIFYQHYHHAYFSSSREKSFEKSFPDKKSNHTKLDDIITLRFLIRVKQKKRQKNRQNNMGNTVQSFLVDNAIVYY